MVKLIRKSMASHFVYAFLQYPYRSKRKNLLGTILATAEIILSIFRFFICFHYLIDLSSIDYDSGTGL